MNASTLIDNRLSLALGCSEDQGTVRLDLAAASHTLVIGPCGAGKTVALRRLAASAQEQDFEVVTTDAVDRRPLENIVTEMFRRYALLRSNKVSTVWDLPDSESLKPIMVVIDGYDAAVTHRRLPRDCNQDAPWYIEERERNAQAEMIRYLAGKILREGRSAGIHLAIGAQRPDLTVLDRESRDHIGNVLVAVRPGLSISPAMVAMVFRGGMVEEMAVNAALDKAAAAQDRGHAVLVTGRAVAPVRIGPPGAD